MKNTTVKLPGYEIIEQIYTGSRTLVYRGQQAANKQPVIIKVLRNEYPSFSELIQFRNQYTIAKNLDLPGIVKAYSLETYGNGLALVLEDFGGISLSNYATTPLELDKFFPIAISITQTLEKLYHNRIIHKDIKPANLLINPNTKEVKITDFSISSLLPRENQGIQNLNFLEGTLAYISPEQTGRMNRGIDYRTDFYSLGVTFYKLVTGQLPFSTTDPMELVHCHIAKQPIAPIEVNPAIPQMVSDIILKLMAKTAEDRYQNAYGISHDLGICYQQWQKSGKITSFELRKRDISDRFVIPEKLYGRETEVATLLAAFDKVSQGTTEMMLVAGYSGIGKTSVVNEVHKPIVRQRGYFISGKFDQFKRNIPFSAFVQAFQSLMHQLLTESAAQLKVWQANILSALGENAQVIIDVIPELERIIGKQPPVPELPGSTAQNRFNLLFQKFIHVFTAEEHPLVIFLDDLQWADSASLKLIQLLISEANTGYLLVIGAYRDNEVSSAHPLTITLDEIRKAIKSRQEDRVKVSQITLNPLNISSLNFLVSDTLNCQLERAFPLTELIFQKTKGNPFFATQFLKLLYEDKLITFDTTCHYWQCNITEVRSLSVTDDVVEFMALQLQKLSDDTQNVLKLAACIGNKFDLLTLSTALEKSEAETAAFLWEALQEGLILPNSDVYKFFQDEKLVDVTASKTISVDYHFLHDRVQQAAYFLIPSSQKQSTHFKIGQLLLSRTSEEEREEKIFEIVNQLNYGTGLLVEQTERYELAQLNLIAGRKAKTSTAYAAAVGYLATGRQLLAANSWQTQYELTLTLHVEAAEAAYLNTDFEQMEELANIVLQNARTLLDKLKLYEVQLSACTAQVQPKQAVEMGLAVLQLLGVNFPVQPTPTDIQQRLAETGLLFSDRKIADFINLPEMVVLEKQAALRILSGLVSPAYITAPVLLPLIVLEMVHLSVQHGNAPLSAFAYGLYGLILSGVVQDIETGYEFGKLALALVERFNANSLKTKIFYTVAAHILYGKHHIKETLPLLREGYSRGLETGELETGYSAKEISQFSYLAGQELTELEQEVRIYSKALSQLRQEAALNYNQIIHQAILNLLGRAENPDLLIGEAYNEAKMLPFHTKVNDRNGLHYFHFHKLIICYFFGDSHQALANTLQAEQHLDAVTGMLNVPTFYFYDSLVRLAVYADEPTEHLMKVKSNQEKLQKWAHHAPMNFLHKFHLVEAELCRVLGQHVEAIEAYDRSINLAQENGYVNEQALANELAAKFYLSWGKQKIAQTYLIDAYYCYARWGAKAKVEQLEKEHLPLLAPILRSENTNRAANTRHLGVESISSSSREISQVLDLSSVLKASQAISGEIVLDKLLSTLMKIVIENAGAQKGALILSNKDSLAIEAIAVSSSTEVTLLSSISLEFGLEIPITAINYVRHTKEALVLDDATAQTTFAADPYIQLHQPKSMLCAPLLEQGKLIGIFYLENNLTTGAFTHDRLEVLKLLCSQAVISLENALLYDNLETANQQLAAANSQLEDYSHTLEEKVAQRTAALKAIQQQVIAKEKLASLGALAAGIAHELRNPLNFVNNYAEGSVELTEELLIEIDNQSEHLDADTADYIKQMLTDIKDNAAAIHNHGQRAESIIQSMMQHARTDSGQHQPADLNALLDQALEWACHSKQVKDNHFNVTIHKNYDASIGQLEVVEADLNRALINIIDNACYAIALKQQDAQQQTNNEGATFTPTLWLTTRTLEEAVEIRIRDNGIGIAPAIAEKIFNPFFTTKPAGEGTGLGLSLTHDIIVGQHNGTLKVESELKVYTEFIMTLPRAISV